MSAVGSQGTPRGRFQRALERGNALNALAAARELGWLPLHDSLSLLVLIAESEPRLYERGAARFLGRLALEERVTLEQLQLAAAALVALRAGSDAAVDCLERLALETGLPRPVRPGQGRTGHQADGGGSSSLRPGGAQRPEAHQPAVSSTGRLRPNGFG